MKRTFGSCLVPFLLENFHDSNKIAIAYSLKLLVNFKGKVRMYYPINLSIMNKNIFKTVFILAGTITFASCTVNPITNLKQVQNDLQHGKSRSQITEIKTVKNHNITKKNNHNNMIVSNANNHDVNYLEQLAHQQINQYRQSRNLPLLKLDDSISKQARIHSQNMAQGRSDFSHKGFEKRIQILGSTIGYLSAAENVAYNKGYRDPATKAVDGWLKSSGHHKNIIGNYSLTGIGVAQNSQGEYYFTQIFILENK